MKKIIHIITSFDLGGAERVAINLAKSNNEKFEFHLVEVVKTKSDYRNHLIKELRESGVCCHESCISNSKLAIILFPFFFLKTYVKLYPQILHVHTEIPDLAVYLFFKMMKVIGKKIIIFRTIHNNILWNKWEKVGKIVETNYKKNGYIIAISENVRENYIKKYGNVPINIVYNGIEETVAKRYDGVVDGKLNILFAGRFSFQKGVEQLIKVVQYFGGDERFHFHIIGNGELEKRIKQSIGNLPNVTIMSKVNNLANYLGSFDYVFIPSNFEGLALLPIEASFAKVPCVINNCPGLEEVFPMDWPLKVSNNDVHTYIQLFNTLPHESIRAELGEKAYLYVKDRFSVAKMRDNVEKLYEMFDK